MAWRDAPTRSAIVAVVIVFCQVFAFHLVKNASERKKEWENFKTEVLSLTLKDGEMAIDSV